MRRAASPWLLWPCATMLWAATLSGSPVRAAAKNPPTIKDLEDQHVDVSDVPPQNVDSNKAMESYKRFLDLNAGDAGLRAEALRRLGDLNLESSESERIERELITNEGLHSTDAIHLYSALLKAYPNYERNDAVLYQLARAYELDGQSDKALAALDRLVTEHPNSRYIDEAQFRRGEILFAAKSYAAAQMATRPWSKSAPYPPFTTKVCTNMAGRCSSRVTMSVASTLLRTCSTRFWCRSRIRRRWSRSTA